MDPQSQICHNTQCPARGKGGLDNIRVHSIKERRYKCDTCGKTFAATKGTALYRLHKPVEVYFLVMVLLSHGCPPQACVAAFGLDERTVSDWVAKAGSHCEAVHKHLVAGSKMELEHVQADELWVKLVGRKVWMAMAMCATSRLWLGGVVSQHRDKQLVNALAKLVRACAADPRLLVCTVGLSSYINALRRAWRKPYYTGKRGRPRLVAAPGLLVGQMVKQYAHRRVIGVIERAVVGAREAILQVLEATGTGVNTAYIERLNATFRARLAPLVRRTRAPARKEATLTAGMWLVGCCYNYCWAHHSLRLHTVPGAGRKWGERTPAMAAGLTQHIWRLEELLSYQAPLPEYAAPKRRGRPPKQATDQSLRLAA